MPDWLELQQAANAIDPSHPQATDLTLEQLDYHGITLLALQANKLDQALSQSLIARKAMMVANEALKNQALTELANSCNQAGITPLVFKGTALAHLVYQQSWLRPRTDTDLLIDLQQRDAMVQVLESLGYQKLFAIQGDLVSYQATYSKMLSATVGINIDLHWRINNRQILAHSVNFKELISNAQTIPSINLMTPSNAHQLLICCLHRLGHHHTEERLTWLHDIHLLAHKLDPEDWQQLTELATQKQLASITLDGISKAQQLFGSKVSDQVITNLKNAAQQAEPSAVFLNRTLPEWRIFLHEMKALPSIKERWRWLSQTLFPSNDYVRQQMGKRSALLAHLARWFRGAKRVL